MQQAKSQLLKKLTRKKMHNTYILVLTGEKFGTKILATDAQRIIEAWEKEKPFVRVGKSYISTKAIFQIIQNEED